APRSPAKNIASAPRNTITATQALLPIVTLGRTGGTGGPPPPNDGFFLSSGSASSSCRAVELRAIGLSINNDKGDHRRNIENDQRRQNQPHAPILEPHTLGMFQHQLTHSGTRSNAIIKSKTGK